MNSNHACPVHGTPLERLRKDKALTCHICGFEASGTEHLNPDLANGTVCKKHGVQFLATAYQDEFCPACYNNRFPGLVRETGSGNGIIAMNAHERGRPANE